MIGKKIKMELRRIFLVDDGMGGFDEIPGSLGYVTGVLSGIKGEERLSADKLTAICSHHFYCDRPKGFDIKYEDWLIEGTTKYNITYIYRMGHSKGNLRVTLLEVI